jgi:hypothetical protein
MGGHFTTDKTGLVTFSLPEFNLKKQISWVFHVDDRSKASSTYDMIIGKDLLGELVIILNFNNKAVTWDNTISMKDRGNLNSRDALTEVYLSANKPQSLVKQISHSTFHLPPSTFHLPPSTKILDGEHKLEIVEGVMQMCDSLNTEEQHQLLNHSITPKV